MTLATEYGGHRFVWWTGQRTNKLTAENTYKSHNYLYYRNKNLLRVKILDQNELADLNR